METLNLDESFLTLKNEQTQNFINKVQERNKTEARLIIAKYDLQNSLRDILNKYYEDTEKINKEFDILFKKRQEFIEFMSKYL